MSSSSVVFSKISPTNQKSGEEVKEVKAPSSPQSPQTLIMLPDNIREALDRKLNTSIERIEKQRKDLAINFNKKFPDEKKLEYELIVDCIKLKDKMLNACKGQLQVRGTFIQANNTYKEDLAALKIKKQSSEIDRIQIRIKDGAKLESKEQKSQIENDVKQTVDGAITKITAEFDKCVLKAGVSYKELGDSIIKNMRRQLKKERQQIEFLDQRDREELVLADEDTELRRKITTLNKLKDSLKLGNLRANKDLHDYLLENRNEVDKDGFTSLFYACVLDDLPLAENLIKQGAKRNIKTDKGYAFYFVIYQETLLTKKFLELLAPNLETLLQQDHKKRNAFDLSAQYGNLTALKWMMSSFRGNYDFDPTTLGKNALKHAASKGHVAIVRYLLPDLMTSTQNIIADIHAALASAFINNRPEVVKVFFDAGIVLPLADRIALLTTSAMKKDGILRCFDAASAANAQAKDAFAMVGEQGEKDQVITNRVGALFKNTSNLPVIQINQLVAETKQSHVSALTVV